MKGKRKRKTRIRKVKLGLLRELKSVEKGIEETNKKLEQDIEINKQLEINEKVKQYSGIYNPMRFVDYSNLEYVIMLNDIYKQRRQQILSQLNSLQKGKKKAKTNNNKWVISIDTETTGLRIF